MTSKALSKPSKMALPSVFENFFKPWWNDWFDDSRLWNRAITIPAVNIIEDKDHYKITVAAPGLKKEDFKINVEGNTLTISAEGEEEKEIQDGKYTRREFNYTSFSRNFTLPD